MLFSSFHVTYRPGDFHSSRIFEDSFLERDAFLEIEKGNRKSTSRMKGI